MAGPLCRRGRWRSSCTRWRGRAARQAATRAGYRMESRLYSTRVVKTERFHADPDQTFTSLVKHKEKKDRLKNKVYKFIDNFLPMLHLQFNQLIFKMSYTVGSDNKFSDPETDPQHCDLHCQKFVKLL